MNETATGNGALRRRQPRPPSRTVAFLANASAAYPLFLFVCLYGQWLLSWAMLGHTPQPSIDDPKDIAGASWMHFITAMAIIGFLPICAGALLLNLWYCIDRSFNAPRVLGRFFGVAAVFVAMLAWLKWDPGRVVYWWFD